MKGGGSALWLFPWGGVILVGWEIKVGGLSH